MTKPKFDGVVEAVHYTPDGQVAWVRAYLRRGVVYTDRLMIDRKTLIDHLRSGKRFVIGKRVPLMGANFESTESLKVKQVSGQEVLVVGDANTDHDYLAGVPII